MEEICFEAEIWSKKRVAKVISNYFVIFISFSDQNFNLNINLLSYRGRHHHNADNARSCIVNSSSEHAASTLRITTVYCMYLKVLSAISNKLLDSSSSWIRANNNSKSKRWKGLFS